jgi:hypothetical protein
MQIQRNDPGATVKRNDAWQNQEVYMMESITQIVYI